jgi:hypothetical protein
MRTSIGIVAALAVATSARADHDWGKADDPKACEHTVTQGQIHYSDKCQAQIDKLVDPGCITDPTMKDELAKRDFVDGKNVSKLRRDKGKKIPQDAKDACEKIALELVHAQGADAKVEQQELPAAKGTNATIEKMIREEIKTNWKGGEQLLKIIFDGATDWTINRNGLGAIVSRSIYATAVYKKQDKCYFYGTYWYQQSNGKAFSGPLEEHSGGGGTGEVGILCRKVK